MTRVAWRIRLTATCAVLVALAFWQSPGLVAADTKLDLTQDPGGFLLRSLHLWDDDAFFGQLQDQAYGYWFPVGPFFWLGHTIGLEPWIVQRLWWSVLLCTAFLGAVRLARVLGILSEPGRWVAGLAFALSPRIMTTLGPISVESLPYALTPWMLLPLASLRSGGSPRRAAALSSLAILLMGGINATATAAAAALGLVWILVETPRSVRARLLGWWVLGGACATLWFLGPLVVLGRYSPPFLDWIESSAVTTSVTDGSAVWRGVTDWVAYVADGKGPQWDAGWSLVSERTLVAATVGLAATAVAGLSLRRARHRRFLVVAVLGGLVALASAHVSVAGVAADGVAAPALRTLLDGVLAPLRNVHKFDVWVRLPLAVGLGWSVTVLVERWASRAQPSPRRVRRALVATALLGVGALLVGVALPALRGDITADRTFASVPGYWQQVAAWLGRQAPTTRALVLPGAPFGTYLWGPSMDEPLQPYGESPWAVRSAVPLSSAGNIRLLDRVEELLHDGRGDPDLAAALARSGVGYVVVRNDLDVSASRSPRPSLVHQTLEQSGGFTLARVFGPVLAPFATDSLVVDGGIDGSYPAVEVYAVSGAAVDSRAVLRDARSVDVVLGEPESILGTAGLPGSSARVLLRSTDVPPAFEVARTITTDTARRVEVDFGRVHGNRSSTLDPGDSWTLPRKVHDYVVTPPLADAAAQGHDGVAVTASSSQGDATSLALDPARGPWNAADGDEATAWFARGIDRSAAWWQVDLAAPTDLVAGTVALVAPRGDERGTATLRVTTDRGSRDVPATVPGLVRIPAELGPARSLRLEVLGSSFTAPLGVAEVRVPGLPALRGLVLAPSGSGAAAVVVSARAGHRSPCVVHQPTVCSAALARPGEEDAGVVRAVTTAGIVGTLRVTSVPRPGPALDALIDPGNGAARATASSTSVPDPNVRAQAAIDGDAFTAWTASPDDPAPRLHVDLPRAARVSWLRVVEYPGSAMSHPLVLSVGVGTRRFTALVDDQGFARFPATTTSSIDVTVTSTARVLSIDSTTTGRTPLPVGISELVLGEADRFKQPVLRGRALDLPCGSGPTVTVDGVDAQRTRLTTTVGAVLDGSPAVASSCSPTATLPAGTRTLGMRPSALFSGESLSWSAPAPEAAAAASPAVLSWSGTHRELSVRASDVVRTLELAENWNAGWEATVDGTVLEPLRVDGWRQAFVVPPGTSGTVVVEYLPDRTYRAALGGGGLAVLVLLALLLVPGGRRDFPSSARPVQARTRLGAAAATGLLALGLLGTLAAVVAVLRVRPGARPWVAAGGVLVAGAPAFLAPWPAMGSWPGAALVLAAIVVSSASGAVVGALLADVDRRSA